MILTRAPLRAPRSRRRLRDHQLERTAHFRYLEDGHHVVRLELVFVGAVHVDADQVLGRAERRRAVNELHLLGISRIARLRVVRRGRLCFPRSGARRVVATTKRVRAHTHTRAMWGGANAGGPLRVCGRATSSTLERQA